jgi:dolichol-phosphate mannosyltransferase
MLQYKLHFHMQTAIRNDITDQSQIELDQIYLGIVCPMANEGAEAIRFVDAVLDKTGGFGRVTFFVILDKATKDNTVELLREHAQRERRLNVVWAPENRGLVDAYVRGYREAIAAGADWILEIDAGFSHDPEDIPKFWEAMRQGYDCVFGTRFALGGKVVDSSTKRLWVSKGGSTLTNLVLGTRLADMTSGFELFSRDALQMVLDRGIQSRAHFFQTEIKTYCRKLNIAEVPITYRSASPRLGNTAVNDAFKQLWRLMKLRFSGKL